MDLLFAFIDTSQTVCKVACLLFVEIDDFDVTETENMHCAKLPDAQDDRICSYTSCPGLNFLLPCPIWIIFYTIVVHDPRVCHDLESRSYL